MNHQKIYEAIITKAKLENRKKLIKNNLNYIYYENHHIIPRCLDGTNDEYNLVLLTAKEHYICHKLLTYIYKGNRKIACAFYRMAFNKKEKYKISSRDYAYARELISNTPVSEETRKKISKKSKEHKTFLGKKHTEESKKKIGLAQKNKIVSAKTKQKQREANLGEKNPMYKKCSHFKGTHLSEEKKNHLRNLYLGKTLEELYGKERAKEIKQKNSKNNKGKNLGKIKSKQERKIISDSVKEYYKSSKAKIKTSETTKLAMQRPEVKEKQKLAWIKRKENKQL